MEVLQSTPFAASVARIVDPDHGPTKINVVIAILAEIRRGEVGSALFLKVLHSKYTPNLPVCRIIKSVNGEVYSAFFGNMLAANYSGLEIPPSFNCTPSAPLLESLYRGDLAGIFKTRRSSLLFSVVSCLHQSSTAEPDAFSSAADITSCVAVMMVG